VLAVVGNMMCATTASMVMVFSSNLWGHASAGVGVLGMVRPPWGVSCSMRQEATNAHSGVPANTEVQCTEGAQHNSHKRGMERR
jgi:hypothetical protein